MGSYYFLIAQLPYLIYGQPAPMLPEAFKSLCDYQLEPADRVLLDYCTLDGGFVPKEGIPSYGESPEPTPSDFINGWRSWERALRLHLARLRFQRLKPEGGTAPAASPEGMAQAALAAKTALAIESPLEAELFLDKSRWDAIETLQGIDYFTRDTIFAYLLKLLLMERRSFFKAEEGFAEYKGLYASIMEAAGGLASVTSIESGEPK
ncbi:MAG: DUF2764 domain-containing protein [Spirochaetaceae bacterium]|nr:DUF2764 domain-containing protein [Spirochaetaceae bacterium]